MFVHDTLVAEDRPGPVQSGQLRTDNHQRSQNFSRSCTKTTKRAFTKSGCWRR